MPKSKQFVLDMSQVRRRMVLLNRRIMPAKARKGLTEAGTRFMMDTVFVLPSTPIKRPDYVSTTRMAGELRASGALFVDGVKKGTTRKLGESAKGVYQPDKYGGIRIVPMSHEACVVFNAPYATTQHESFPNKSQPGAGTGYMREKLYGNGKTYIAIVARAVRL